MISRLVVDLNLAIIKDNFGGYYMGSNKKNENQKRGRDAKTGKFISIEQAKRRPKTTVIETIKPKKK